MYTKTYRYPEIHKEEVQRQIDDMLHNGIIRKSNSPYSSPIWIVPKHLDASGKKKWRIVVDYRKLNEISVSDKFPIPNIDEILDKLGRANYFSTLDLAKGFHQIEIDPSSIAKTAFSTNLGHYEFTRMPFGLKNAPATFQRLMNEIFGEYIGKFCMVYLDDIIIFSTSLEEHTLHLKKVLKKLSDANLKIQVDKCEFMKHETEFLGHVVTHDSIKPNPNKIDAILKIPVPATQKQIKSFLGLIGYYRKFIKDFAMIAKPMTLQLKKDCKQIKLTEAYVEAFNHLKKLITQEPILKRADYTKEFKVKTDASQYAIGAVLSQSGQPICFASRTLNAHEINYSTIERELLAIVWACKYFRPYIYGREFLIQTDHRPLTWIKNLKDSNPKLQRWKAQLDEYDCKLEYIKGKENVVADSLSRPVLENSKDYNKENNENRQSKIASENRQSKIDKVKDDKIINIIEKANTFVGETVTNTPQSSDDIPKQIRLSTSPLNSFNNQLVLKIGDNANAKVEKFYGRTRRTFTTRVLDEKFLSYLFRNHITSENSYRVMIENESDFAKFQAFYISWIGEKTHLKLYRCNRILFDMRDIESTHELILKLHKDANHRGIMETYNSIKEKYYYPNLKSIVQKLINNCYECNVAKYERHPQKPPFNKTDNPRQPNEIVHMDIWYHNQKTPYLTFIDKFSEYAQIIRIKSKNWLDIKFGLLSYIATNGKMKLLVTDNEKAFQNLLLNYCNEKGISVHHTTPYSHTGNSDIERFHGTLNEHIRILVARQGNEPEIDATPIEAITFYNHSIHSSTKKRPIDFKNGAIDSSEYLDVYKNLIENQEKRLTYHNKKRKLQEDSQFVKVNNPHKHKPLYKRLSKEQKAHKINIRPRKSV